MTEIKTFVDRKIAGKKVVVFSKSYCPYCTRAKQVFQKYLLAKLLDVGEYEVIEIENDPNCAAIQEYLGRITGASSVPRVFVNGKFIGGGDDTVALDSKGQLKALLA